MHLSHRNHSDTQISYYVDGTCTVYIDRLAIIILQILGINLFFYSLILLLLFSEYPAIILLSLHNLFSTPELPTLEQGTLLDVEEVLITVSKVVLVVLLPELNDVSNC